jgi:hypothetical protein
MLLKNADILTELHEKFINVKALRHNFLTGLTVFGTIKIWDRIRFQIRYCSIVERDLFYHGPNP